MNALEIQLKAFKILAEETKFIFDKQNESDILKHIHSILSDRLGYFTTISTINDDKKTVSFVAISISNTQLEKIIKHLKIDPFKLMIPVKCIPLYWNVIGHKKSELCEYSISMLKEILDASFCGGTEKIHKIRIRDFLPFAKEALKIVPKALLNRIKTIYSPIVVNGETFGIISIRGNISKEDIKIVRHYANLAGYAIENLRSEHVLRELESKYRTIVTSSHTGILIVQDDKFVFVNKKAQEIFGYSESELKSMNAFDIIAPEHRYKVIEITKKRLNGEKVPDFLHYNALGKYKKTIQVESRASVITYNGKSAILTNILDITDKKQMEREKMQNYRSIIRSLSEAVLGMKGHDINGHSQKVRFYSVEIARQMVLPEDEILDIELASELHDVGKIGVSSEILNKKGKLTKEEYETIKMHTLVAADRISNSVVDGNVLKRITDIIKHHHERYDGSTTGKYPGYPSGLKASKIPIGSRIIAVADSFEAMTTDRPYRKAMPKEKAVQILLKEKGKQFDPKIVDIFVSLINSNK